MMALLVVGVFLLSIAAGVPIAFSLGFSALAYLLVAGVPVAVIPQTMFAGLDSFVMLAIPAFILSGNLMNAGGITNRIIDFANALAGRMRGGLVLSTVASPLVVGGICVAA